MLTPGVYYLQGGLKIQDSATLSSRPLSPRPGRGVLIYVENGVSVTNSAQLTLAAPTSGSYSGIGLWDFDNSPINLSSSSSISGVLSRPGSTITGGDGADLSVGAMVSASLTCPPNGLSPSDETVRLARPVVSPHPADGGETLIELLIATLILAIAAAALINSLSARLRHRLSTAAWSLVNTVLRSFAESAVYQIEGQPVGGGGGPLYTNCAVTTAVAPALPGTAYALLSAPTPATGRRTPQ